MPIPTRPQGRHVNLLNDLFSLFASPEWASEAFLVTPKGYASNATAAEYARFEVVSSAGLNDSLSGILFVEIFTPNGVGPTRAYQIADLFDKYLAGATLSTQGSRAVTQVSRESSFSVRGESKGNNTTLHSTYQIPFSHFRKE